MMTVITDLKIQLEIPELAPSLNGSGGLMRMHWAKYGKKRDAWTLMMLSAFRSEPGHSNVPRPVSERVRIEIERHYASQPLDIDNLYAAAKVPLDALRKTDLIRDDDPDTVTALRCTQTKVSKRSDERTIITIKPEEG